MAYRIDFTASEYSVRTARKATLRTLLLAAAALTVWGVQDIFKVYTQPTLNEKLRKFQEVTHPIEDMNRTWDEASQKYDARIRYYRLLWGTSPAGFLSEISASNAPRLSRAFRPKKWILNTGGECQLDYAYVFGPGDKAAQTHGIRSELVNMITSCVAVAADQIDVRGIVSENLLSVSELELSVRFPLPGVVGFHSKEGALSEYVKMIDTRRNTILDTKFVPRGSEKQLPTSAREIMMAYLPYGRDKADFPRIDGVIDVATWFDTADKFAVRNKISTLVDYRQQKELRRQWSTIGNARLPSWLPGWLPWCDIRFPALDNERLVRFTNDLRHDADGVRMLKDALKANVSNSRKKLDPFVEAYLHQDVFNNPIVEKDLQGRVASALGMGTVSTAFRDETGAEPAVLERDGERFTFTWVRWTMSFGDMLGRDADRMVMESVRSRLTLGKISDCIRAAWALGPGYATASVRVNFGGEGEITGAKIEGLLPVKQVEQVKKEKAR